MSIQPTLITVEIDSFGERSHPNRLRVQCEWCQNWSPSYNYKGMARPIVTKFGVRLDTKQGCILNINRPWVRYICTCALAHVQMYPFSASRKRCTDCAEIWFVVSDPLARFSLQKSTAGYICTCARATCRCATFVSPDRLDGCR